MRKALGRGLDALIPASAAVTVGAERNGGTMMVPIEKIRANHLQPRKYFDAEKLSELSASIKEHGLAQPILVSYDRPSDTYEIIAGERRLRACELAGLREVEVVVRTPDSDKQRLAIALIENLQREGLNPIEEALGYLRLMREFNISQTELTKVIGRSKSAISNNLRLLELSEEIQKSIEFGQLTEGHARALLMVDNPLARHKLFVAIRENKLSVRQAEDAARGLSNGEAERPTLPRRKADKAADIKSVESDLQRCLGTKVEIRTKKDPTKGTVTVHFYSLDDFDKVINLLKK